MPSPEQVRANLQAWTDGGLADVDLGVKWCQRCGSLPAYTTVESSSGSYASCVNPACQSGVLRWAAEQPSDRLIGDLSDVEMES